MQFLWQLDAFYGQETERVCVSTFLFTDIKWSSPCFKDRAMLRSLLKLINDKMI